jgi:VanZ family protein
MIDSVQAPGGSTTPILPPFRRGRWARWACVYALAVIYVSVVLGPFGFNFVPRDPAVAWRILLATPYLANGSNQRPDWMANLMTLIPLGFLTTGALWPDRGAMRRAAAAATALLGCVIFVLSVKYAQIFFPPRTVSLNYITAQSVGSLVGVTLFCLSHHRFAALRSDVAGVGDRALILLCGLYALAYLFFLLFPFDVALSGEDLRERAAVLPQLLFSLPGAGLPLGLRLILPLVETAATVPIGVWLALARRDWPLSRIALTGILMMSAATVASMLLLDTTPSIAGLTFRATGIVIGAVLTRRLAGSDPSKWRDRLARLVRWLIAPYVIAVLYVKNLLALDWQTMPKALAGFDPVGLLPFYHHYIVSKEHAAASVAFELTLYGPIGVMIALRRGSGRVSIWLAALTALAFSFAVEFGRWLRPGLLPDFSNPIVAAVGAGLAVKLATLFWSAAGARPVAAIAMGARERGSARRGA